MNVKNYVWALLCLYLTILLPISHVNAQALKVGDTLPEELWSMPLQVVNHPEGKETITLREYKDKLIILDFWATWCSPCVAMLPKMDSLQKKFEQQIQVLPVTYQTAEEIAPFLEKYARRKGVNIDLPKIVDNKNLKPYFNHATIPHYVWIKEGVVKAITDQHEVTGKRISELLNQKLFSMNTKTETPLLGYPSGEVSLSEFLAVMKPERIGDFFFRSSLSHYIPGLSSEVNFSRPTDTNPSFRITLNNLPLLRLYQFAYGEGKDFTNLSTISVETSDSLLLMPSRSLKEFRTWIQNHTYCYELVLPESFAETAFEIFRRDLSVFFPKYQATIEEKTLTVLALEKQEGTQVQISEAPSFKESFDGFIFQFEGAPPSLFVKGLNSIYLSDAGLPIIDMTDIDYKIDLRLEANPGNIEELNKALHAYGFSLTRKQAPVQLLVIRDNANYTKN